MADQFLVAAVQMVSTDSLDINLERARMGIAHAAEMGAQLVVLPEYFCILSPRDQDKVVIAEAFGSGPIQNTLARAAREAGVWLVGGTVPIKSNQAGRIFNTQLVYSPEGTVLARYDKIHLFNFKTGTESYDEAKSVMAGTEPIAVDLPVRGFAPTSLSSRSVRLGLSTCYDLRFPELYRALGTVDLIVVPAAFTATTGRAHWETLLRARAIENQAYVLAAAQGGEHPGARHTWGHSMLIDPWGEIIAEMEFGEGVIVGEVSSERIQAVRSQLPALQHRVLGINR